MHLSGNQKPNIEEEQTIQWPKEKGPDDTKAKRIGPDYAKVKIKGQMLQRPKEKDR